MLRLAVAALSTSFSFVSAADAQAMFIGDSKLVESHSKFTMPLQHIPGTIARALGTVPPEHTAPASFLHSTLFTRPRANLLISVEGLSQPVSADFPQLTRLPQERGVQAVSLDVSQCSGSRLDMLSCLASGYPTNSGISVADCSTKVNLADRVIQTFEGNSLSVSFSGKHKSAFCAHSQFANANHVCVDTSSEKFEVARSEAELTAIFKRGGSASLLSALVASGLNAEFADGVVTVILPEGKARLRISNSEDAALLMELQGFYTILQEVASNSVLSGLVKDGTPDLFFASFTLPNSMKDALHTTATRRLLDAAIVSFLASFDQLYHKSLLTEVVFLDTASLPAHGRSLLEDPVAPTAAPAPIKQVTDTERQTYQIMVWVSVGGAFVVLFAFYSTAFMGFKKDTLLYSTFNPKWDDRKNK